MRTWKLALTVLLAGVCAMAHAKDDIRPAGTTNPPPSEALGAFQRYEVKPAALGDAYAGQEINRTALASFQRNLDERVGAWATEQNAKPTTREPVRTLVIEPRLEKIRFISGATRVFAGAFAGSSRVLVKVRLVDQDTGAVVAEPEFYQHAKGMAGAWTFGVADNNMLIRTAQMTLDYLKANQDEAVGAPTGWEAK